MKAWCGGPSIALWCWVCLAILRPTANCLAPLNFYSITWDIFCWIYRPVYWAVAQLMDGAASEQTFEDALYKSVETRANETVIRVELCLRLGVQAAMSASVIPALEQRSFSASICFYSQA